MFAGGEHPCGHATGFLIVCRGQPFIATNWHVVTGKNPKTGITNNANPQTMRIFHRCVDRSQYHYGIRAMDEPLYTPDDAPRWVEHDQRDLSRFEDPNLAIDLALLPLSQIEGCVLCPYYWESLVRQPYVEVGSEVSIIGYPLHKMGVLNYPIWKTGHIASDFEAHPDQKHFLVDSVTREGMSGSPVVVRNRGGQLLGIYSGRLQDDPEFGIGIVWRWMLLHELLEKYFGGRLFR
jgi:hypothetical protein